MKVSVFLPEFGYYTYNPGILQIKVSLNQFHNQEKHAEQGRTAVCLILKCICLTLQKEETKTKSKI